MVEFLTGALLSKVLLTLATANAVASVVSNDWAIPLNTLLLVVLAIVGRLNTRQIKDVQKTTEKTFQSTTHAANAAEGAARSAAISTIVASKHLGVDLRDEDMVKLTEALKASSDPDSPTIPPAS